MDSNCPSDDKLFEKSEFRKIIFTQSDMSDLLVHKIWCSFQLIFFANTMILVFEFLFFVTNFDMNCFVMNPNEEWKENTNYVWWSLVITTTRPWELFDSNSGVLCVRRLFTAPQQVLSRWCAETSFINDFHTVIMRTETHVFNNLCPKRAQSIKRPLTFSVIFQTIAEDRRAKNNQKYSEMH